MLVFVINQNKKPLMPCKPSKARKLLQAGKAKVVRNTPFTIKLLFGSSGYTQPVTAGMDTGSKVVGCAAIANGKVLYQSEIYLRENVS
ncbi:MAG: RRXRR domain-containing protein, partial [Methanosarcina sp.]|nr:RRXRR domain-containing protein [Methanosarcina sp.]